MHPLLQSTSPVPRCRVSNVRDLVVERCFFPTGVSEATSFSMAACLRSDCQVPFGVFCVAFRVPFPLLGTASLIFSFLFFPCYFFFYPLRARILTVGLHWTLIPWKGLSLFCAHVVDWFTDYARMWHRSNFRSRGHSVFFFSPLSLLLAAPPPGEGG